ncbi:MAG TPA: Crp/Fnr family transcriptional regulator [Burkholderiales bacterium]|nr:Crp/Fnr family transcriptional regulator [Burkholderiales bacterium]
MSLKLGEVISEPWSAADHVYFPNESLVSLIALTGDGAGVEVGIVGNRGLVGVSVALGAAQSATRGLVQAAGTAERITAKRFSSEVRRGGALQKAALRYANVSMATAMQVAACNNVHTVDRRLARWLLMTSDLLASRGFFLTQEFLAHMLGVRRTGVSEAAASLQRRGLISYRRGSIVILDRPSLLAASCGCYETIRKLSAG